MEFNLNTLPKSLLIILLLALVVSGCSSVSDIDLADSDKSNSFNTTPHRPLFQGSDFFIDTVVKNNRLSPTEADEVESIVDSLVRSLFSNLAFNRSHSIIPRQEEKADRLLALIEFDSFGVPTHIYFREPYFTTLVLEADSTSYLTGGLMIPHVYTQLCQREPVRFSQELLKFVQPVLVTNLPLVGGPDDNYFMATTYIDRTNLAVSSIDDYRVWLGGLRDYEIDGYKCRLDLAFSAEKARKAWGELRWVGT